MRVPRALLCLALCAVGLAGGKAAAARPVAAGGHGAVTASASGHAHFVLTYVFGLHELVVQDFSWWARVHADGTVEGAYAYSDLEDGVPFTASGPVTCLVVRGSRVWAGGTVTATNDPTQLGLNSWWQAADNRSLAGAPDMTTLLGTGAAGQAQAYCDAAPDPRYPWPVRRGTVHVRDRQD
jgi:hypothetical protein